VQSREIYEEVLAVSFAFGFGIRASDNSPDFEMAMRQYQIARLYGPGIKLSGEEGPCARWLTGPLEE